MQLARAKELGTVLMLLLSESGTVEQIQLAGSIRRCQPFVKDIEIVVQPFPDAGSPGLAFSRWIEGAVDDPDTPLAKDGVTKRWGEKYKRLRWRGEAVDLFVVTPPAQWGAILALRTGPADFSRALVTGRKWGGAMPSGLKQELGRLVAWGQGEERPIETPTEQEYFHALDLPWIKPEERTVPRLIHILSAKGHGEGQA